MLLFYISAKIFDLSIQFEQNSQSMVFILFFFTSDI